MNTTKRVLGVFAKYWQPGVVKTRLAITIGNAAAADLHYVFLKTTLRRFESVPVRRQLYFDPEDRIQQFHELAGPAWELVAQCKGELGSRLQHFFSNAFAHGASQAVAIGADSPNLPLEFVVRAMWALDESDVVLGPSADGGYYLIGLARSLPSIFAGVPWGTQHVWHQTVERLARDQIPFVQLPPWYDVDEFEDLERLSNEVRNSSHTELQDLCEAVRKVIES